MNTKLIVILGAGIALGSLVFLRKNHKKKIINYLINNKANDNIEDEITQLMLKYNANIKISNISKISSGLTNLLYVVEYNQKKKLLVRIYGENTEVMINRNLEEKLLYKLGKKNFAPKLLAIFNNGRIEEFIESITLDYCDLASEAKLISKELAFMHSIIISDPIEFNKTIVDESKKEANLWKQLNHWGKMGSQIAFNNDRDKQKQLKELNLPKIMQEIDDMQKQLLSSNNNQLAKRFLFDIVLCHNDLLAGNILKTNKGLIKFVDFEYGSLNYRGFDIGNHFSEYAGFDFDIEKYYPNREEKINFIKSYIEGCFAQEKHNEIICEIHKLKDTQEIYDQLIHWVDSFALMSSLYWGLWAIIQSKYSHNEFDFLHYAKLRFDGYYIIKKLV